MIKKTLKKITDREAEGRRNRLEDRQRGQTDKRIDELSNTQTCCTIDLTVKLQICRLSERLDASLGWRPRRPQTWSDHEVTVRNIVKQPEYLGLF